MQERFKRHSHIVYIVLFTLSLSIAIQHTFQFSLYTYTRTKFSLCKWKSDTRKRELSNDQFASNEYLKVCSIISGTSDCSETNCNTIVVMVICSKLYNTGKPSQSTEMFPLYNYVTCKYRYMIYIAIEMQQFIMEKTVKWHPRVWRYIFKFFLRLF